jgi:type IV pilus biogenesis protein CpaD/CtpE
MTALHRCLVLCIVTLTLSGSACREEDKNVVNKLDPRLKMQVEKLENAPLSVLLQTAQELSDEQRRALENMGVVIQSGTGTVYVCQIPLKSVMPVAREKFVLRLDAPKELRPQ